jgi:hypothetical protein
LKVIAMLHPGNESQDMNTTPHAAAIAPQDFAMSEEPIFTANLSPRRFQSIRGGRVFMMIIFVAGALSLARLSLHVTHQAQELDPADSPGAGITVRTELLRIWLPRTLTELAERQTHSRVVRTHEELRRFLELNNRKDLWYALTMRGHQADGNIVEMTFIQWPYDDSRHFRELQDILATAAGNPPRNPGPDYSKASIYIIAQELLKREPREVMAELLRDASPAVDEELCPVTSSSLPD